MSKKIFVIAGEPSGDVLGAALIKSLKETASEPLEIIGIGGPLMEEQGLQSLLPMEELCVMGLWEVIGQLPRLMKLIAGLAQEIEKQEVDAVITIDLPDFNFQLAARLKKRGICQAKIIHYVAPTVWAWRPGRAEKISKFLDGLMCLFPFEPELFSKHGLQSKFVGHPLIESKPRDGDARAFRKDYEIPEDALVLGVFFGSREGEFQKHAETLIETALIIKEQYPDLHLVVPTIPSLEYNLVQALEHIDCPCCVVSNPEAKWDAFAACDAAVAVSGTVGLELAYVGIPHVIAYKMHPVSWMLLKRMVRVEHAHLANILLKESLVPEFLQNKCNSLKISKKLLKILKLEDEKKKQKEGFVRLREMLGAKHEAMPSKRAAAFVLTMIGVKKSEQETPEDQPLLSSGT